MAHRLQGARQHDMVEGLVGEFVEALFQVALQYIDAIRDGGKDVGVVDLDTDATHAAGIDQVLEKRAVAAAEVEHTVAGFDPGGNDVEVGASQRVCHSLMFRR
ncbi:hypothetical protein SDC9_203935 [bioreactor metagenome]|uniref:Uncharacterized protein n=1 Tax=bioreactor metagenome TaxID=1076179 RepID=A0A645J0K6_9ZZZZ